MAKQTGTLTPFPLVPDLMPLPVPEQRPRSREEVQVDAKRELHLREQAALQVKTLAAQRQIHCLHGDAHRRLSESSGIMLSRTTTIRDTEHRRFMEEQTQIQLQMLSRHTFGTLEAGAAAIARVAYESVEPDPEPPAAPLSLWEKAFGRRGR